MFTFVYSRDRNIITYIYILYSEYAEFHVRRKPISIENEWNSVKVTVIWMRLVCKASIE